MEKDGVICGVCGGGVNYFVLADAIMTQTCPKGCGGSTIIMRGVMEDALVDMDKASIAQVGGA